LPILKRNEFIAWESMGAYTTCIADGMLYNMEELTEDFYYVFVQENLMEGKKEENFEHALEGLYNFVDPEDEAEMKLEAEYEAEQKLKKQQAQQGQ